MFKTRLLSGILLVLIALFTVISGGSILFLVLLIISMIGLSELYKVFDIRNKAPGICGYLFAAAYYALIYLKPVLPAGTDWEYLYSPFPNTRQSRYWQHFSVYFMWL